MKRLSLLFCALLLFSSCGSSSQGNVAQRGLPMKAVQLVSEQETVPLIVEIAITAEQMEYGLMFRKTLPKERGMLFIFEEEKPLSFWMKNTLVPLDVLYFNANGTFVSASTMEPCTEDPCPEYPSEGPAKYALEVVAGFVEAKGIGSEWKLVSN